MRPTVVRRNLLHAVKPKGAGWLPKPHHVLTEFTDDQQSEDDLAFCLEGEEQFLKAAAYYEREHVACCLIWWGTTPNCCSLKASDIGIRIHVCKASLLSNSRLCTCRDPRRVGKSASRKHFFQVYHFANEQVASLHPSVRKQLMLIGDGTGSLLLTKIIQGANEAADLVDSMVDDDGINRESEMKQQYEKFGKDMIDSELIGGQNGSANVSHLFLKPMDGDTFKMVSAHWLAFCLVHGANS